MADQDVSNVRWRDRNRNREMREKGKRQWHGQLHGWHAKSKWLDLTAFLQHHSPQICTFNHCTHEQGRGIIRTAMPGQSLTQLVLISHMWTEELGKGGEGVITVQLLQGWSCQHAPCLHLLDSPNCSRHHKPYHDLMARRRGVRVSATVILFHILLWNIQMARGFWINRQQKLLWWTLILVLAELERVRRVTAWVEDPSEDGSSVSVVFCSLSH